MTKIFGRSVIVLAGILDTSYGIYNLSETERRYRLCELDGDIRTSKNVVAAGQIGVGASSLVGAGVVFLYAPEPVITKIIGAALIASSLALGGADCLLERTQANRTAARQRLFEQIDERERYHIVIDELQNMLRSPAMARGGRQKQHYKYYST